MYMRNLLNKICIFFALIAIITPSYQPLTAQNLVIVKENKTCKKALVDTLQQMVELKSIITNLQYDLCYATPKQFHSPKLVMHVEKNILKARPCSCFKGGSGRADQERIVFKNF